MPRAVGCVVIPIKLREISHMCSIFCLFWPFSVILLIFGYGVSGGSDLKVSFELMTLISYFKLFYALDTVKQDILA